MKLFKLSQLQQQQVIDKTQYYINIANQQLKLNLLPIEINFDLMNRCSGMFIVSRKKIKIRYNEIIFAEYFEDSLINTVAHEVAHYVVYSVYGLKSVKPHGIEWKNIMAIFSVKPDVTSHYEVGHLPLRQQRQHEYSCGCSSYKLSTTRHYKVLRKQAVYRCVKCKQPLYWVDVGGNT